MTTIGSVSQMVAACDKLKDHSRAHGFRKPFAHLVFLFARGLHDHAQLFLQNDKIHVPFACGLYDHVWSILSIMMFIT